jgi:hypothetical protein
VQVYQRLRLLAHVDLGQERVHLLSHVPGHFLVQSERHFDGFAQDFLLFLNFLVHVEEDYYIQHALADYDVVHMHLVYPLNYFFFQSLRSRKALVQLAHLHQILVRLFRSLALSYFFVLIYYLRVRHEERKN